MSAACCRRITAGAGEFRTPSARIPTREYQRPSGFHPVTRERREIVLRSWNKSRRLWLIDAVSVGPTARESDGSDDEKAVQSSFSPAAVKVDLVGKRQERRVNTAEVVVAATVTVVLGVGNRVLYKLALVPLKHYPFFLAQLATLGFYQR